MDPQRRGPARALFFRSLTAVLLILLITDALWPQGPAGDSSAAGQGRGKAPTTAVAGIEARLQGFQGKLFVGALELLASRADELRAVGLDPDALRASLGADLSAELLAPQSLARQSAAELRRTLALAAHLEGDDAALRVLDELESRGPATAEDAQLLATLRALIEPDPSLDEGADAGGARGEAALRSREGRGPVPPEDLERLRADLGWFGDLLLYTRAEEPEKTETWAPLVFAPARATAARFAVALAVGLGLALLCLGSFAGFLVQALRGRLRRRRDAAREQAAMRADFALEIFALYLLCTFGLAAWVRWFGADASVTELLALNIVAFLAMIGLVAWPLLFGTGMHAVRMRLGLWLGSPRRFAEDLMLGPLSYLASWAVLALVLVLYALLLTALGVDASRGAHPVVPILLSPEDEHTAMLVILLGVLVAPLVEEIMFRGALYGWLRGRFGPVASIGASAFAFAAMHPQGVLGLVPLTFIGCVLGALREWRGNLVTPIVAHACFNGGTLAFVLFVFGSA